MSWYVKNKLKDSVDSNSRQISNISFPVTNIEEVISQGKDPDVDYKGNPSATKLKLFGTSGINTHFNEHKQTLPGSTESKTKTHTSRYYNNESLSKYGMFLMQNNPINPKYSLKTFSTKLSTAVDIINATNGISYTYSEYDQSGARMLAMALEANGYLRYDPSLKYSSATGLPTNLSAVPTCRLLSYRDKALLRYNLYRMGKDNLRCAVCGKLSHKGNHRNITSSDPSVVDEDTQHKFIQATYIIVTGSIGKIDDLSMVAKSNNKQGHIVKAILGTKVTGEGVDFKNVRSVIILDPWHNATRIY